MFEQLKIETKNNHILLEKLFTSKIKNINTEAEYGALLGKLHDYYAPLEIKIRSLITEEILPDIDSRRKAPYLLNDMVKVNYVYDKKSFVTLPTIESLSGAAGALYVLEGSTHGGPYIAKMIQQRIKVPTDSFSYFTAYGDDIAYRWNLFREALESKPHLFSAHTMIKSANETFTTLHNWLHFNS